MEALLAVGAIYILVVIVVSLIIFIGGLSATVAAAD